MALEKFTDKARKVTVLAQNAAKNMDSAAIGTEHVFLGLIDEGESFAAQSIEKLGVKREDFLTEARKLNTPSLDSSNANLAYTTNVKHVFEYAYREALQMSQSYIGTEHLLLGIIETKDCKAMQILETLGFSEEDLRNTTNDVIGKTPVLAGGGPETRKGKKTEIS